MRKVTALFVFCSLPAFSAPVVTFIRATQTQALVAIRGATGACQLALSDDATQTSLMPDVDGSKYQGAGTDTGRADTVSAQDGTRMVTLGHMTGDRALAALTTYYLEVSGCGGSAKTSFTTANVNLGTTQSWPVPFDATKWGNRGWPVTAKSLVTKTRHIDPLTGVVLAPASNALDWTARYPGGGHNPVGPGTVNFAYWAGGFGWSNPVTVLTGPASTATTNTTNPIDLYPGTDATPIDAPYLQWSLNDIGTKIFGSGTDGQAVNRQFTVCLFVNPVAGCVGKPITITAKQSGGAPDLIESASSDPDRAWPNSFPEALFGGWGTNVMIHTEDRATSGTVTAVDGVLTIDGAPDYKKHFSSALEPGNRIYVAGTDPVCPHNLCTLSGVRSATQAVVAEKISKPSGTAFVALRFGVRIQKLTNTGNVTIGAAYKLAGSVNVNNFGGAENTRCGANSFTSGDQPPKTGYICSVTTTHAGVNLWYFFATDGTARMLYNGLVPDKSYFLSNLQWDASDVPAFGALCCGFGYMPGDDARTWYVYGPSTGGKTGLYSMHYDGDTTEDRDWKYTMGVGTESYIRYPPSDKWTWSVVVGSANDLATQITANFPAYNAAMYGTAFGFVGVSGTTAFFQNLYNKKQDAAAWIAVVDISSGSGILTNLIHTVDGTGTNGYMRFGGLHNGGVVTFPRDTQVVSNNPLAANDNTMLHGGPFAMPITGVMRGGMWSPDTTLPWPIDTTYDSACPSGNPFEALGATGGQCATLLVPAGGWCNVAPRSDELATWPCPVPVASIAGWNAAAYAQPFPIQPGDVFVDPAIDGDAEHFRVVAVDKTIEPDGQYRVVVQRNSMWDYCCFNDGSKPGNTCVGGAGQTRHASGWKALAFPPRANGCITGVFVITGKTENGQMIGEIGRSLQGHGELVAGTEANTGVYINSAGATAQKSIDHLLDVPMTMNTLVPPTFHGATLPIGGGSVQSYVSSPGSVPWFADSNTLNNNYGCCREGLGMIANRALTPAGTPNVYKIAVLGTVNYKIFPLLGFAGRYNLKDVSGPASNVAATPFTLCYVLKAGECYSGSAAGDVYVNVPAAYDPGGCAVNQHWANVPCVISGLPGAGGFRQQAWQTADKTSAGSRFLTYLFDVPGGQYAYGVFSTLGATLAWGPPTFVEGWGQVTWLTKLPPWPSADSATRTDLLPIPIQVPAGPPYAEIQFGYSRWIGPDGSPTAFRCMPRQEACNTSGDPYSFDGESKKLTSCAAGCTINIPAMAPNVLYYRIRRSNDGTTWVNGEINATAVP
jgi:hypothetical protein